MPTRDLQRRDRCRAAGVIRFLACAALVACSVESAETAHDEEPVGQVSAALSATDTVAVAVEQSCTTAAVKGLATQLVDEIQCLHPDTFARIDNTPGLDLGSAVFPFLQESAAKSLLAAQKARGKTMSINSGLRTLPQQFLLYRWYQTGRCGIGLAATPGTSNHESGLAVDVDDNAGWRAAMTGSSFKWLGASDPVHYDFVGSGSVDLKGLSVKAFQRLWNRNHPTDLVDEDGDYGPATSARLAKAPVGGFAIGAVCNEPAAPSADPPATTSDPTEPVTYAAPLPVEETPTASASGCSATPLDRSQMPAGGVLLLLGLVATYARKRGDAGSPSH